MPWRHRRMRAQCEVGHGSPRQRDRLGERRMTVYQTQLMGRETVASGTMAFHFAKPAGFRFKPGQAIDVVLLDPPAADAPSTRHTFSIVSAPFENELVVATRMRDSAFKRALGALPIDSPVEIDGPSGSLTLHNDNARS